MTPSRKGVRQESDGYAERKVRTVSSGGLRNRIGAATVRTIELSGGMTGFWDPPDAKTFLTQARQQGFITVDGDTLRPTTRGRHFLNELLMLFLAA